MSRSEPSSASIDVHKIGVEKRSLILIDGFLPSPERLVEVAKMATFQPNVRFFPGVQAPFPFQRMAELISPYARLICETFDFETCPEIFECGFAMVTTPPSALQPLQRIPHIDTTDPNRIAILAYISADKFGGTAFYQHRSTGYEYVDGSRLEEYNRQLDRDVDKFGVPPPAYITGDTDIFRQIAAYKGVSGRALIYRSNSLHSGMIQQTESLSHRVSHGRLTLNAFASAKE